MNNLDRRIDTAEPTEDVEVLTVSELSLQIKDTLARKYHSVWLVGEVSDLARPQSGHMYLTLKDDKAQIRAVIWRATAQRLPFPLDDGTEIICCGEIDVYPPRGSYQLILRKVELRGEGAAQKALRKLKAKLAAAGLFDPARKRPLPAFPRRIAVITSPTGAAIRDFLQVAGRRWRGSDILVVPAGVQGPTAVEEIIEAMHKVHQLQLRPDVLVVTRGGGSMEDLWCFNDERLVRAICRCRMPVISAVGHEIDVTLADLAADVRALTPSEAAERALPSATDVRAHLGQVSARINGLLTARIRRANQRLESLANRRVFRFPFDRTQAAARHLDELQLRTARAMRRRLTAAAEQQAALAARLEALSPLAVLARGYSVTQQADGSILADARDVDIGQKLVTRLHRGKIISRVEDRRNDE